jgi:cytochrome P450
MAIAFKALKGPKGLPVIGSLHKIEVGNMHNQLEDWAAEYGMVYKLILGPSKLTVITDPDLIQEVLKQRPEKFRRMAKMDDVLTEAGVNGVFNAEGERWKAHRRIINKGLDVKHQQHYFPEILTSVERLFHKWNKAAKEKLPVDIQQDTLRFTVDVTTSLAFGYPMNTLEEDGDVIQNHLENIFPVIFKRINAPIPTWRFFKSKKDKAFDQAMVAINKFIDELLVDGKKRLIAHPELNEAPTNFLESLLVAAQEEEGLTDEDLRGNLLTVLMAGEDTTAHTLSWAVYLLADHPEIQEQLFLETEKVLGDQQWLDAYSNHSLLVYTEAVVLETMRLKPVAPMLLHEPLEDVEVNGYSFKKGAKLLFQCRYAGVKAENFVNPLKFDPKRWVAKTQGKCPMGHDTKAFIPFGAGARFCPGKNLAMLELKLVLSMLLKNFKIEFITPKVEVKEVMAFTMMPSAFQVKLIQRN